MKRVAILAETALASGRAILAGISRYLHEQSDWSVFHHSGPLGSMEPSALNLWKGDGIIARISNQESLELTRSKGVPVVDILGNIPHAKYPLVSSDDPAIGQRVAEHFIDSGHRHFAFVGLADERWSQQREASFRARSQAAALTFHRFLLSEEDRKAGAWTQSLRRMSKWLGSLPAPLGLMVASDQFAPTVFEACKQNGFSIPERVSIVSVDNDLTFCDLCQPRLSSVEPNHNEVGYQAAKLLDRIMSGATAPNAPLQIAPLTLHRRESSDVEAVEDVALAKALQAIRKRACFGISVDEVAQLAGLSRSVLQRRFRRELGKTVGRAILDVKLRRACHMLSFTNLPILDVALKSGFSYQEYLNEVFKRHLQTTPAKYRAATKPGAAAAPPPHE